MFRRIERLKEDIVVYAFIVLTVLFIVGCYILNSGDYILDKEYPMLEDSIAEVDELIGEYSGYYVAIDTDRNNIKHKINGVEISENNIVIVVPENLRQNDIILDFYTSWNDYLASYKCDFTKTPIYSVHNKTISVVKSDLQFVYIDVDHDAMTRVKESNRQDKGKEKAKIALSTISTNGVYTTISGKIQPRGNSSWNLYDKLPYSIKLKEPKDLFGFGKYKKWNLLANASDKTLLKDIVYFDLADNLDLEYTPQIKNINLFINGWYEGVYCITTKVDNYNNGMNLSNGDFLINWGSPHYENAVDFDCNFWLDNPLEIDNVGEITDRSYVEVVWPDEKSSSEIYKDYIHDVIQDYVDVLEFRKEGKLSDYIDLESFAKYYWVEEISMNGDAWSRSFFTYYNSKKGKLYAGPIWDMEWALGCNMEKNGINLMTPWGWKIRQTGMFESLFKHQEFVDEVNRVYEEYNIDTLMKNNCDDYASKSEQLASIGELNYIMYSDENNYFDFEYSDTDTYKAFVNHKLDFYNTRISWIENEMNNSDMQM